MTTQVSVLLVDDHPVVRRGVRAMLAADPAITVLAEAATGEQAIELADRLRPDVILMDLQLGAGIGGVEVTRAVCAGRPPSRVLVLTTYDSDADILPAIEAGATGYLLKDAEPAQLIAAVHAAARGETVLAPSVASQLLARVRSPSRRLTAREIEIVRLVADGATNQAVARRLFITEATVKSHLVQIFGKLEVGNRTSAIAAARQHGYLR